MLRSPELRSPELQPGSKRFQDKVPENLGHGGRLRKVLEIEGKTRNDLPYSR